MSTRVMSCTLLCIFGIITLVSAKEASATVRMDIVIKDGKVVYLMESTKVVTRDDYKTIFAKIKETDPKTAVELRTDPKLSKAELLNIFDDMATIGLPNLRIRPLKPKAETKVGRTGPIVPSGGNDPNHLPPALFEVWVIKDKQGKPQYLMQGHRAMSLKKCRERFDAVAKHDSKQGVILKVDPSIALEPVQALVKECQGAGLKSVEFLFLKAGFGASKPDPANQKKIEAWAKKAGISQRKIEDLEVVEEIVIEEVGEGGGPIPVPTKPPVVKTAEEDDQGLDIVKTNSPLTYVNPMAGRGKPNQETLIAKYGGSDDGQIAVDRALRWLASVQNENGSWGENKKTFSQEPGHPAHTGLALLTFLGRGETPLSEKYGKTVQKAMRWLAEYGLQSDLKTIVKKKHGAYTHGIATLALSEAYAMTKIPFLQAAMENSVDVLIAGQMKNGGFGYAYNQGPRWDLSVAGWNIQALRAAQIAGSTNGRLKDALHKSITFCALACGDKGAFAYTLTAKKPNMVGIGTLSLQILGAGSDRRAAEGCARIVDQRLKAYEDVMKDPTKWKTTGSKCLYGWYYDTQAVFNAMGVNTAHWKRWRKAFESVLIKAQHAVGYWETVSHGTGPNTPGRVLSTCWATLQLQVYYRYSRVFAIGKVETPELKKKVETLIQRLGAESFKERQAARKELMEMGMGRSAYMLLEKGLKTDDPEIKHALKEIIDALADE